jgi:hypothetical protein
MMRLALAATSVASALAHGAIVYPRSRNAVDYTEVDCDKNTDGCTVSDACDPSKPAAGSLAKPHRYWRIDVLPEYMLNFTVVHGRASPPWLDICSLDFFGSLDGTGPSLLPAKSGAIVASPNVHGSWPSAPTCSGGNSSSWEGMWQAQNNGQADNYLGWDFGSGRAVSVRSVRVKQFDTGDCARSMAVQFSDDGACYYDAWFVDASENCPHNTTSVGGHAGVTVSPPAVRPNPSPSAQRAREAKGDGCVNHTYPTEPCHNGQASFWYSQGCFIGCPTCDGLSGRRQTDLCGLGKKATLPDYARSVNRNATRFSPQDIYRHNPWSAGSNR